MSQIRSKAEIDALYKELNFYADQEYVFAIFYERYINQLRDYGNGVLINMVEVHTYNDCGPAGHNCKRTVKAVAPYKRGCFPECDKAEPERPDKKRTQ